MSATRTVKVYTATVGTSFGTIAVVRDARTGRKVHATDVKPFGSERAARRAALDYCDKHGLVIVD